MHVIHDFVYFVRQQVMVLYFSDILPKTVNALDLLIPKILIAIQQEMKNLIEIKFKEKARIEIIKLLQIQTLLWSNQ